jgi:hypothetical protein
MAKSKKVKTPIEEFIATIPKEETPPVVEGKRSLDDTRLSYSSYQTIKACEQKYYHYKIANTPYDTDYNDEKESLILGKAFHSLLEFTKHTKDNLSEGIKIVQSTANIENDKMALVVAMANVYLRTKTTHPIFKNLNPIAIEMEISDKDFIGFIDVIFGDIDGNWYIGDLKTTARQSETLKARLEMDAQLHLYSSYAVQIAEKLGLDISKFKGSLYISTNKTTIKRKASEMKLSDYVTRLEESIETRIYVVPMDKDKTKWVKSDFMTYHSRTKGLRKVPIADKNYSNCEMYFTPCPYFSKCHGHNYTEANLEIWSSHEV